MKQVSIFDAEVHVTRLVEQARRGATIVITRQGRPMPKFGPVQESRPGGLGDDEAMSALRDIRSQMHPRQRDGFTSKVILPV